MGDRLLTRHQTGLLSEVSRVSGFYQLNARCKIVGANEKLI